MTEQQQQYFLKQGFSQKQIEEIALGMENGVPVSVYAFKELMPQNMYQIRRGLEEGFDMHAYATPDYGWFQLEEIRLGFENNVDVSKYDDANISYKKMHQIRRALEEGNDLSEFISYEHDVLKKIRESKSLKIDIIPYVRQGYNAEQLEEILNALKDKLDIFQYIDVSFPGAAIHEIAQGYRTNADVDFYARDCYSWKQMREIRVGMEKQLDISYYMSPLFDHRQMEQIRLGLEEGLEVEYYNSLMYTANEMEAFRNRLKNGFEEEIVENDDLLDVVDLLEVNAEEDIHVSISDDDMEAYLTVSPNCKESLTKKDILKNLRYSDVTQNINMRMIDELLQGKHIGEKVLIAVGRPPRQGEDGRYEFFVKADSHKAPKILSDGSVDYSGGGDYEMIKVGQKIAYYHSATKGIEGRSVTNKRIPATRGKELEMLKGKGFFVLEDRKTYVASTDGKVELNGNLLEITKVINLEEANANTGNIRFNGNVEIAGDVRGGIRIEAGQDVIIGGFVEDAFITAGGNITIAKGVNGGGVGELKAGGEVTAKFFEMVKVTAGKCITANYSLNSELYSEGEINLSGKKSVLVGASAFAAKEIKAIDVGNMMGVQTKIKLGVSDKMKAELYRINTARSDNNKKLDILIKSEKDFQSKFSQEERDAMEMYIKIENAIYTLNIQEEELKKEYEDLMDVIAITKDACLVVMGNLYDNVLIEIDGKRTMSTQSSNVTVKKVSERVGIFKNN